MGYFHTLKGAHQIIWDYTFTNCTNQILYNIILKKQCPFCRKKKITHQMIYLCICKHLNVHSFRCILCHLTFKYYSSAKLHVHKTHYNSKVYISKIKKSNNKCILCGEKKNNLILHTMKNHFDYLFTIALYPNKKQI